jgi:hypothetical protein
MLRTLIWLKWKLFRNAMRSRKAKVERAASTLGTIVALAFALVIALGLGIGAYVLTSVAQTNALRLTSDAGIPSAYFVLFMIFSFLYMLWATLPLSIGGGNQFDPGRLLMYPVSLRKLFLIDLLSELTSFSSLFAIPATLAMGIGAGLGIGSLFKALLVTVPAIAFGIAVAKWLATSIGSLTRKKRGRGEIALALIGTVAGLGGALVGQLAPVIMRHAGSLHSLLWTPSGAAAYAMTDGLKADAFPSYLLSLALLIAYAALLIAATYWIAQRLALGTGGARRRATAQLKVSDRAVYTGWSIPLLPSDLSAIIEKETRYALRNAQLAMLGVMPLILLVVRYVNGGRMMRSRGLRGDHVLQASGVMRYGEAWMATVGVLYVFMILAGVACNAFAFEEGGMRTLILAPIERRRILIGKNVVVVALALIFSLVLLTINEILFRDLTAPRLLFVALSFVVFAVLMSLAGNWFSISFPKRMKYGKRMNLSGVAGLLLLPVMLALGLPPLLAAVAGYIAQSLLVEYVTLAAFAGFALVLYLPLVTRQGRSLKRRELEVLEAVSKAET